MSKIKLLIEISEEIYQEAIKSGYSHLYDEEVANAVANGTLLLDLEEQRKEVINASVRKESKDRS